MDHMLAKTTLAALAAGILAGCATTVDMGGPLGHYRYDSRPLASETTVVPERVVTTPAPDVAYREKTYVYSEPTVTYVPPARNDDAAVVYRESRVVERAPSVTYVPRVTTDSAPTVVYRESRVVAEPTVTWYSPTVVYGADDGWLRYQDHGQ